MGRLLLILALLSLAARADALSVLGTSPSGVTLAWDANTEPDVDHYVIQKGAQPGGPYSDALISTATSGIVAGLATGGTYYFIVRAINTRGFWSAPSNEVSVTIPGQTADDCAPVTGRFAISVFPTSLLKTGSGGANSKTRFDFQVASPNAPVTAIVIKASGVPLASMAGGDLTALAGMWFPMPTSGTYTFSVTATNSQNCSRTAPYNVPVVVP